MDETQRAVRFLYLNRYCFNGVYRTNKAGKFNVPRGTRTGGFPNEKVFEMVRDKLAHAELIVSDYTDTLKKLKQGDFVYIDPPYTKTGKNSGEYGPDSFKSDRIPEFISHLTEIDKKGVKFLLSYRACEDTVKLLSNRYHVEYLSVKRHIAGFKENWGEAQEILVRNYEL
ncbi:MAG: DNA adenine methylase, partial [Cyclobacteriaceae bacterium]|nr:DNA adenine methylase [Cyclobacteriaceae bacterium]